MCHSKGLKIGIYTDIGKIGCGGKTGSYGYYQQEKEYYNILQENVWAYSRKTFGCWLFFCISSLLAHKFRS